MKRDVREKLLEQLEILKRNGADTSKISQKDTLESLAKKSKNADIEMIKEELEKNGYWFGEKIGNKFTTYKMAAKGKTIIKPLTDEQVKILADEYGISLKSRDAAMDPREDFIKQLDILKRNGVDTSKISQRDTIESLAKKSKNADIDKIKEELEKNGYCLDDKIGPRFINYKQATKGKSRAKPFSEEQVKILEEKYGIFLDKKEAREKFMERLEILKRNGVDTSKLNQRDTLKSLAEKSKNIDIEKISEELKKTGYSLDDQIGNQFDTYKMAAKGKCMAIPLTEEQVKVLEEEHGIKINPKEIKTEDIAKATCSAQAFECDKAEAVIDDLRNNLAKELQNQSNSEKE